MFLYETKNGNEQKSEQIVQNSEILKKLKQAENQIVIEIDDITDRINTINHWIAMSFDILESLKVDNYKRTNDEIEDKMFNEISENQDFAFSNEPYSNMELDPKIQYLIRLRRFYKYLEKLFQSLHYTVLKSVGYP